MLFILSFAARQGLEPRYHGPKPCVLPLDDRAIFICSSYSIIFSGIGMVLTKTRKTISQIVLPYPLDNRVIYLYPFLVKRIARGRAFYTIT